MANHRQESEGTAVHHPHLDAFNWPVLGVSFALWPWLSDLWSYMPAPTALYMVVSAAFMLFQMSDKLGLLERFKRDQPTKSER